MKHAESSINSVNSKQRASMMAALFGLENCETTVMVITNYFNMSVVHIIIISVEYIVIPLPRNSVDFL